MILLLLLLIVVLITIVLVIIMIQIIPVAEALATAWNSDIRMKNIWKAGAPRAPTPSLAAWPQSCRGKPTHCRRSGDMFVYGLYSVFLFAFYVLPLPPRSVHPPMLTLILNTRCQLLVLMLELTLALTLTVHTDANTRTVACLMACGPLPAPSPSGHHCRERSTTAATKQKQRHKNTAPT